MNIAVVGASNNPQKYGYRIVKSLLEDGHRVFPVNLKETVILGQPVYKTLADIDHALDIVDIVVPPEVTMSILEQARDLGHRNVWVQPGAENDQVVDFLKQHARDFERYVYNDCIMTSLNRYFH